MTRYGYHYGPCKNGFSPNGKAIAWILVIAGAILALHRGVRIPREITSMIHTVVMIAAYGVIMVIGGIVGLVAYVAVHRANKRNAEVRETMAYTLRRIDDKPVKTSQKPEIPQVPVITTAKIHDEEKTR